ncbi:MAG: hypothetical protein DRJ40_11465 [Thermoprotei archaeon]|nr:MAG: hypothetical protein DRJ40_11465 [Thermoprotei archaeon]
MGFEELFYEYFNPKKHAQLLEEFVRDVTGALDFISEHFSELIEYEPKLPPRAVVLAGAPSVPAFLSSFVIAERMSDRVRYVITSHEVVNKQGVFRLSGEVLEKIQSIKDIEVIVVDFTKPVRGSDAEKLMRVIKSCVGGVIVNQASGFVSDFICLNAGCTMLCRPYPDSERRKLVFYSMIPFEVL